MKHDQLCPAKGKFFINSCQCSLIAKVRNDEKVQMTDSFNELVDKYVEEYARGMAEGYRLGRKKAGDDLVALLDQYNLPHVANIEFVIRNGIPNDVI